MMKKYFFLFLIILFINTPNYSQQSVDRQIQIGLDKIYNFNWTDGLKIFNTIIEKNLNDPRGYHYKSTIYLWYYLGNLNEAYLDTFNFLADKAIDLSEKSLDKKSTAEQYYLLGSVYYNKSIAEARSGNYLQALWTSNQMKQNLEEAIKIKPAFYDAYLGIGLYNFALSQIPSSLEWAANLVGITADKEAGLQSVKMASQKGKFSKVDAQFYLSQLYSRVIVDHPAAKELLTSLVRRYPKNLLFNFSLAWVNCELNDLNNTEKYLKPVLSSKDTLYPFIISNSYYILGNVLFAKNMYDSAATCYKLFLEKAVNNDYKGISNLKIGLCYELTGNRKDALKFYEKASDGNSDIEEDLYAERKMDLYIEKKLSPADVSLIRYSNLIKQGRYGLAKDSLMILLKNKNLKDEEMAIAYMYLSEISHYQKRFKESLEYAVTSLKINVGDEKWVHAFSHYYAAWASYHLKNYIDARLFLLQIEEMDEYDFANSMVNKVYSLKRLLPAETKK